MQQHQQEQWGLGTYQRDKEEPFSQEAINTKGISKTKRHENSKLIVQKTDTGTSASTSTSATLITNYLTTLL